MFFEAANPPYTLERQTASLKVPYFINPSDVESYSKYKLSQLDRTAEATLVRTLRFECDNEVVMKRRLYDAASGWFFQDPEKMQKANEYQMPSCRKLDKLGVNRR